MNNDKYSEIINNDSISFVKSLYDKFGNQLQEILKQRTETDIKKIISVRQENWACNRIPDEVKCRQVEITGPANDTKLFINALNSDADVFMADIEDSQAPTCDNILQSQLNFRQAHSGNMTYFDSKKNKEYVLQPDKTILMVRPRGLHLPESHFEVNRNPIRMPF